MYFCGGAISGPWFEFRDFQDYMANQGHYKEIPSTVVPTLKRIALIAVLIVTQSFFSVNFKKQDLLTDDFAQLTLAMKLINIVGYGFYRLNTYIIGFCFMESGPIASGLSFNGYSDSGAARHDRVKSVTLRKILFFTRTKDFIANWNISVHNWLKHYVYIRMLENSTKRERGLGNVVAAMVTFCVSGIWHGFYPGYVTFFFSGFVLDCHNQLAAAVCAPLFAGWCPEWLQRIGVSSLYLVCCVVFSMSFFLQYYEYYSFVYVQTYWCVHILIVGTALVLIPLQPKSKKTGKIA